jgi:hypothetical protein
MGTTEGNVRGLSRPRITDNEEFECGQHLVRHCYQLAHTPLLAARSANVQPLSSSQSASTASVLGHFGQWSVGLGQQQHVSSGRGHKIMKGS